MSIPFSSYRTLAVDIDGTLLRSDQQLSQAVPKAIDILSRHRVEVILTSSRLPQGSVKAEGAKRPHEQALPGTGHTGGGGGRGQRSGRPGGSA